MPVDLDTSEEEMKQIAEEIKSVPKDYWFYSPYRGTDMLALFSGGGEHKRSGLMKHDKDFEWTEPAIKYCPTLIKLAEERIHPWMVPLGRIIVIQTKPTQVINLHIDCSMKGYDDLQHKFRIVPQGRLDTLWFLGEDGERHYIDGKNRAYVLDGSHPHGMDNTGEEDKYTICWGSPWTGENSAEYDLIVAENCTSDSTIFRDSIGRPYDESLFQEKVEGKEYWKKDYSSKY